MTAAMRDWQGVLRNASQPKIELIENVVVPLDGTELAKSALPVARLLAQLYRATLHVAYVGESALGPKQTLEELGLTSEEIRGAILDQLTGSPADAILTVTRQLVAPLLVMCTHTCGNHNCVPLGQVAEAVLAGVPPRIILLRPEEEQGQPWRLRRILLAHDGTPTADLAIAPVSDLAHRSGAEVIALHVAARTAIEPEEGSLPAPRYIDQPQHEWPAWAGEFLDRMMALGAAPSALNFKLLVTGGQPGSEVAQFARDHHVDLVALAWQGRLDESRAATMKVIVHRAGCPVLIVGPGLRTV